MKLHNQKLFIIIIKHFILDFLKYLEYFKNYKLHKIFKTIVNRENIINSSTVEYVNKHENFKECEYYKN